MSYVDVCLCVGMCAFLKNKCDKLSLILIVESTNMERTNVNMPGQRRIS